MNLGDMKLLVKKLTSNRLASSQIIDQDTFLGLVFNEMTIPDFVGRHDWFFKEIMETSQMPALTYVLQFPTTLQDISVVILDTMVYGTTKTLDYIDQSSFYSKYPSPQLEASGYPAYYTYINRELWLDRPTSANWNLRIIGLQRFPKLVLDSDSPTWLDDDKHMLLVYCTAGFVYQTFEDAKNAQIWLKIYEDGTEKYWTESERKRDAHTALGKFLSNNPDLVSTGQYWLNPFVMRNP
jgi:hypothetical protein